MLKTKTSKVLNYKIRQKRNSPNYVYQLFDQHGKICFKSLE
jgi:hypothetical protein